MFWGLAVFAPVGVNYLAALLMLVALLAAGNLRERAARLRASPLWWPIVVYVGWTLVVLAIAPHYPQTPSNLWHGLRIALTMLMALALTRDEAIGSLRGFFIAALASLAIVLPWGAAWMRWAVVGVAVGVIVVAAVILPPIRYRVFWYAISPTEIDIQHGIIFIKRSVVPMHRVQPGLRHQYPARWRPARFRHRRRRRPTD